MNFAGTGIKTSCMVGTLKLKIYWNILKWCVWGLYKIRQKIIIVVPLPKKAPVLPMGCVWYYSSASFKWILQYQTQPVDKSGAGKEKHTHTSGHIYYSNGNRILALFVPIYWQTCLTPHLPCVVNCQRGCGLTCSKIWAQLLAPTNNWFKVRQKCLNHWKIWRIFRLSSLQFTVLVNLPHFVQTLLKSLAVFLKTPLWGIGKGVMFRY